MNKTHPVQYYYKDTHSGIEMNFTKTEGWGWAVSFPKDVMQFGQASRLGVVIPWPELSEDEKAVVEENYKKLRELTWEDDK